MERKMSCWSDESIKVSSMAAPIKSGFLLRYKKRFFGKDWREEYVTLYDDSSLIWCRDRNCKEPEGGIYIKDAPEMMAFGNYATKIPNRPLLPEGYTTATLLVFGTKEKDQIHWFLCKYETELQEWATAISNTLPPPPQPQPPPSQPPPSAPLNNSLQQTAYSPNVPPQPATNPSMQQPVYHAPTMPGQFPAPTVPVQSGQYLPPGGPLHAPYPQRAPPPSSNTTVVVQDRGRDGVGGTGDFAMGMLVGGAIGSTWGHGIGWGYGGGWGGGYHGTAIQDTDVHIHNHYDNDTTVVNNFTNQQPTTGNFMSDGYERQDFDDGDFDGGDFGGDDFGGDFDGGDF